MLPLTPPQLLESQILRATARVLELSAVHTTTALTYLHTVQQQLSEQASSASCCSLASQELVCACIYLAAKVEEVHVSTNQLINTARVLADPTQQHLLQALAPLPLLQQQHQDQQQQEDHHQQQPPQQQPAPQQPPPQQQPPPPSSAVVVGDEYYAAKEALFMAEQVVLRLLRFQLGPSSAQQPLKYLFNFCRLLGLEGHQQQEVARAAVCALNDAVAYTNLLCRCEAAVVAAAALQHVLLRRPGGEISREAAELRRESARGGASGGDGGGSSRDNHQHSRIDGMAEAAAAGGVVAERRQGVSLPDTGGWVVLAGLAEAEVDAAQQELAELYRTLLLCNSSA